MGKKRKMGKKGKSTPKKTAKGKMEMGKHKKGKNNGEGCSTCG